MIRPVDTSLLDAVAKTTPDAAARKAAPAEPAAGKDAFAKQLKRETQKAAETTAAATTGKAEKAEKTEDARGRTAQRAEPPEGEKWRPVKGRDDYAEIIAGDRKGQNVNLNRGSRRGEAFTIEERDGKTVHVYKREDGELVVPIETKNKEARAAGARASDREPPKGETWAPVKGKPAYADILSGPRNGYYVNLQQGSKREGDIFHIVKRGGKHFHVYGEGSDKTWVEVGPNKTKKAASAAQPAAGSQPAGNPQPAVSGAPDNRDATQSTSGTGGTGAAAGAGGSSAAS